MIYLHIFPVEFPAIFPWISSVRRWWGNDTGPKEHVETSVAAVAEMLASAKDGDLGDKEIPSGYVKIAIENGYL